jgi:hypothetical protein
MKAYIIVEGDLSVGVPMLDIEIDLCFDPEEEEREWIRKQLDSCFSEIYGQKIGIEFEDERQIWIAKEEEVYAQQNGM